jgi:hypothetical protein
MQIEDGSNCAGKNEESRETSYRHLRTHPPQVTRPHYFTQVPLATQWRSGPLKADFQWAEFQSKRIGMLKMVLIELLLYICAILQPEFSVNNGQYKEKTYRVLFEKNDPFCSSPLSVGQELAAGYAFSRQFRRKALQTYSKVSKTRSPLGSGFLSIWILQSIMDMIPSPNFAFCQFTSSRVAITWDTYFLVDKCLVETRWISWNVVLLRRILAHLDWLPIYQDPLPNMNS